MVDSFTHRPTKMLAQDTNTIRVSALRTRDGQTIPYEHKHGRCRRDNNDQPQAWESDRLQILAYLLELSLDISITEGRIRYHADNAKITIFSQRSIK